MRGHVAALWTLGLLPVSGCFESNEGDGPAVDASDTEVADTHACGQLGCSSGVYLSMVAQANVFDAGRYDVTFIADGQLESCQFTLASGDPCGLDPICVLDSRCEGPEVQFNFVLTPHTIGFVVGPDGAVDQLGVDVERDGRPLLSQTLVLSYEDYAPNGVDCEPICRVAQAELPLP